MVQITYKVYAKMNGKGEVVAISNSPGPGWMQIDEGTGDRYKHASTQYLPDIVYHGKFKYLWNGEELVPQELERPRRNDARIATLKLLLAQTDYVALKIAEGAETAEQNATVLANRRAWREEINRLEEEQ